MCPGQGAQRVGMGRDLAERFPAARDTFAAIDDALGVALSRLMWEGPEDELTLTHNTQPAILAHSAAVWAVVKDRVGLVGAAAGHSLGEYSAHVAAVVHGHNPHARVSCLLNGQLHGRTAQDDAQPSIGVYGGRSGRFT